MHREVNAIHRDRDRGRGVEKLPAVDGKLIDGACSSARKTPSRQISEVARRNVDSLIIVLLADEERETKRPGEGRIFDIGTFSI